MLSESGIVRAFSGLPQVHSPEQISQLTHARLAIFFRMIESILLQSLIVWPKTVISEMVSRYSKEIYENVGMKQKVDAVIDSLWDIDQEIIPLAYREKEYWDLDWKEGDGWRRLLALVKDKGGSHS